MIDVYIDNGKFKIADTAVFKAKNILEIQEDSLYYELETGIDLKRFLDPDVQIQNTTFEAYSIQRLGEQGINTLDLVTNAETFRQVFDYSVAEEETGELIR
jgi:hypothetical protein